MRVISGKYKGRKILVESKSHYRPTLTRVREDIFNLLSHNNNLDVNLNNVIFCDLFAGTGSIGIEALSRGAKKVIFNDIEKNHTNKIEKFIKNINEENYEVLNIDPYKQGIDFLNYEINARPPQGARQIWIHHCPCTDVTLVRSDLLFVAVAP